MYCNAFKLALKCRITLKKISAKYNTGVLWVPGHKETSQATVCRVTLRVCNQLFVRRGRIFAYRKTQDKAGIRSKNANTLQPCIR